MPSPRFSKTEGEPKRVISALRLIRKSSCTTVHSGFLICASLEIPPFALEAARSTPRLNSHLYNLLIIRHLSSLLLKITVDSDGFQTPRNPQQKFFTVTLTRYVSIINNTFDLSRGVLRAQACRHVFCHLNAGLSVTKVKVEDRHKIESTK